MRLTTAASSGTEGSVSHVLDLIAIPYLPSCLTVLHLPDFLLAKPQFRLGARKPDASPRLSAQRSPPPVPRTDLLVKGIQPFRPALLWRPPSECQPADGVLDIVHCSSRRRRSLRRLGGAWMLDGIQLGRRRASVSSRPASLQLTVVYVSLLHGGLGQWPRLTSNMAGFFPLQGAAPGSASLWSGGRLFRTLFQRSATWSLFCTIRNEGGVDLMFPVSGPTGQLAAFLSCYSARPSHQTATPRPTD